MNREWEEMRFSHAIDNVSNGPKDTQKVAVVGLINRTTRLLSILRPDGSKIAFVSDRDGNFEIYVSDPGGGGHVKRCVN